jgi:hypothetical protein
MHRLKWPDTPVSSQWLQTHQLLEMTVALTGLWLASGQHPPDASDQQFPSLEPFCCWSDSASPAPSHYLYSVRSSPIVWPHSIDTTGCASYLLLLQRPIDVWGSAVCIEPDSTDSIRSLVSQRPVNCLTLHSLSIRNPLWMKLTPLDLWAVLELPSAKFDKCTPHLNYWTHLCQATSSYLLALLSVVTRFVSLATAPKMLVGTS